MAEGVFPRAGRYLGSRPAIWLAGAAINAVILIVDRRRDTELAYLAAAATGVAAILVLWTLDSRGPRSGAAESASPRAGLTRLAAVAFAVGIAWALTSIALWLVPAVGTLVANLGQVPEDIY